MTIRNLPLHDSAQDVNSSVFVAESSLNTLVLEEPSKRSRILFLEEVARIGSRDVHLLVPLLRISFELGEFEEFILVLF